MTTYIHYVEMVLRQNKIFVQGYNISEASIQADTSWCGNANTWCPCLKLDHCPFSRVPIGSAEDFSAIILQSNHFIQSCFLTPLQVLTLRVLPNKFSACNSLLYNVFPRPTTIKMLIPGAIQRNRLWIWILELDHIAQSAK